LDSYDRASELLEHLSSVLRAESRSGAGALQPVQRLALAYLGRCNRYSDTPGALADYLGLTKGTVSQSLNHLEREGLIERLPDPEDRRRVRLRLTPAGRSRLRGVGALGEALGALEPERVARLAEDLAALLRSVQVARGGRTFGLCRTCRHFQPGSGKSGTCGLTGERLSAADSVKLCREHEYQS